MMIRSCAAGLLVGIVTMWALRSEALPRVGAPCPSASLETVEGERVELRGFLGRPVLIVYEDRDSRPQNQPLKLELWRRGHDRALRAQVKIVPVVDVRQYDYWPARGLARRHLRGEERRLGHEIYPDFTGAVARAFGMRAGQSNLVLIDREGRVVFAHAGPLSEERRRFILDYLTEAALSTPQPRSR